MNISALLQNKLLMAALLSWLCAQVLKTILYAAVNRRLDFSRLMGDGGMPSGHSATVTALAASAARVYGLGSPLFAVCAILAVIVMHDAMGVRLEAGKHAKAINELTALFFGEGEPEEKLQEFLGHTPLQVFFGALLGLLVALLLP